jgi:hypothetical protein
VWNDLPHAWPIFLAFKLPESFQALGEIVEFIQTTSRQKANAGGIDQTLSTTA